MVLKRAFFEINFCMSGFILGHGSISKVSVRVFFIKKLMSGGNLGHRVDQYQFLRGYLSCVLTVTSQSFHRTSSCYVEHQPVVVPTAVVYPHRFNCKYEVNVGRILIWNCMIVLPSPILISFFSVAASLTGLYLVMLFFHEVLNEWGSFLLTWKGVCVDVVEAPKGNQTIQMQDTDKPAAFLTKRVKQLALQFTCILVLDCPNKLFLILFGKWNIKTSLNNQRPLKYAAL